MSHPPFDKVFAENLGATLGGCVRDQIVGFFNVDAAKAAKVFWIPIPFVGMKTKCLFKSQWAAALQGIAVWAMIDTLAEFKADQKLLRKAMFQQRAYVDYTLSRPVISKLDNEKAYLELRVKMEALAQSYEIDKFEFARGFLKAIAKDKTSPIDNEQVNKMAQIIAIAYGLFCKVIKISVDAPLTYEKVEKKKVTI